MPSIETARLAPVAQSTEADIVRRFLAFAQRADAAGRAEAASALARAYLYSELPPTVRTEAVMAMTAMLDDSSALVRRALAEALASASDAPRHIVLSLASDQSDVAAPVLARSPVLTDAELVDCAAVGDAVAQIALSRRPGLSPAVAAALAEIGEPDAVMAVIGNLDADLPSSVLRRAFERFGDDAALREALLQRPSLPAALRADLVAATARALGAFLAQTQWLGAQRAHRLSREACDEALCAVAATARPEEREGLAARLRESGALTVALLMRALLGADRAFFTQAIVELTALPHRRVVGALRDGRSPAFSAVFLRAGLPAAYLPAFRAALVALDSEGESAATGLTSERVRSVITTCENRGDPALARLLTLLWRFAGEAARVEARAFAQETVEEAARPALVAPLAPLRPDRPASPTIEIEPASLETSSAPRLDGLIVYEEADIAPRIELSLDRIGALDHAA